MAHVFIHQDALDQHRILQLRADFGHNLNQLKIHITMLQISDRKHGVHRDFGQFSSVSIYPE